VPASTVVSLLGAAIAFALLAYSLSCACDRPLARRLAFGTGALLAILALSARAASLPALRDSVARAPVPATSVPVVPAPVVKVGGPTLGPAADQGRVAPSLPVVAPAALPGSAADVKPAPGTVAAEPHPRTLRPPRTEAPGRERPRRAQRSGRQPARGRNEVAAGERRERTERSEPAGAPERVEPHGASRPILDRLPRVERAERPQGLRLERAGRIERPERLAGR
jgi:hypothetical protein